MRIILAGGGTGGHIFPCVAVADRLKAKYNAELLFIGGKNGGDKKTFERLGLNHELIPALPFPHRISVKIIPAAAAIVAGIVQSIGILRRFGADVMFATGGYVSVPAVIAARILRLPVVCHASDAHIGRASKMLARYATRVTSNFQSAAEAINKTQVTVTGQPIRKEFTETETVDAKDELNIPSDAFVILVMGGSQGARSINNALIDALETLLAHPELHVLHVVGSRDFPQIQKQTADLQVGADRYYSFAFHDRPWTLMGAADLCITRAGANSLDELAASAIPMIIVPYPHAAAHQRANAEPLIEAGGAIIIDDDQLSGRRLVKNIDDLRTDSAGLNKMSAAAAEVAKPDAAENIAAIIAQLA